MSIDLNSLDEEVRKKVINLQNLSTTMEYLSQQKLQIETSLRDTELAIEELEKINPDDVVYKSIGGILVKSEKNKLLDEKKSLKVTLEMRLKTLKQKEERVKTQIETMRKSIQADFQK
ncbi:MAG: prefoldin subunit beta [Candidatus Lokiarchaeota archaeon]|nr:prefoldin subunit beta [Candidatus Lokiarchaeota archaeon]